MKAKDAAMVAMHLAAINHRPSFAERAFDREREIERERVTFPKPKPGHSFMVPHLLRAGIFALSAGKAKKARPVAEHDDLSDRSRGAQVDYVGPVLRQYDCRTLLGLVQRAGGMHRHQAHLSFDASDFLVSIGKPVNTDSVDALRASFVRLRSATFAVKTFGKDRGTTFTFIYGDVVWNMRHCTITLSASLQSALEALSKSWVPLTVRNGLTDGLETALADLLYATSAESFDIKDLAIMFDRPAKPFGAQVRKALQALVDKGVLESWSRSKTRGRVNVKRNFRG